MAFMQILLLDTELVPTGCVASLSPPGLFSSKLGLMVAAGLCVCIIHCINVCFKHRRHFRERKSSLVGALGLLGSIFFISVVNSIKALSDVNSIPMGDGHAQHTGALSAGSRATIAYLVWLVALIQQYSARVVKADQKFMQAYSFLHTRFRPEVYWYIIVPTLRSFLSTLALVVPDKVLTVPAAGDFGCLLPHCEVPAMEGEAANWVDVAVNSLLVLLLGVAQSLVSDPKSSRNGDNTTSTIALLLTLGVLVTMPLFFLKLLVTTCSKQSRKYDFFLCQHKVGAGALSRLIKMSLCEADPSREVFLDADSIGGLNEQFYIIREEAEVFVLIGSGEFFTSPWKVGELTTCVLACIDILVLELPSYSKPSHTFIEEVAEHINVGSLIEQGLTLQVIQEALGRVQHQTTIKLPEVFNNQVFVELERHLASGKLEGKIHFQRQPVAGHPVGIMADHNNTEASASAFILERILKMRLPDASLGVCFAVPPEAVSLPREVTKVALLCSAGCLESALFVNGVAMLMAMEALPLVVSVVTQDSFRFPTKGCFTQLREYLQKRSDVDAPATISFMKYMFKEIALIFQPQHASELMLRNQGETIMRRLCRRNRQFSEWQVNAARRKGGAMSACHSDSDSPKYSHPVARTITNNTPPLPLSAEGNAQGRTPSLKSSQASAGSMNAAMSVVPVDGAATDILTAEDVIIDGELPEDLQEQKPLESERLRKLLSLPAGE
eukprot:CAMPEP_0178379612 /NCGR_PEP_ID=MMETSP0689_2-20121128/5034_1 /TAXON_ID=160604 /ORGANISM="Amphidinium massartii, Strain CS-259" /LENGTH=724 /DNA_ID=CAMNT_0019999723 /DNA_START=122 /DNA_END=2296 /DNA_ORIENTATION=-